jgi:hypothetical protein
MLATIREDAEELEFRSLNFDARQYNYFRLGERGVWGIHESSSVAPRGAIRNGLINNVAYQAIGDMVTATMVLRGSTWAVIDTSSDGEHILAADWNKNKAGAYTVRLHYGDAVGNNRRVILTHEGALGDAYFSPDGRFVVSRLYTAAPQRDLEVESLVLLDLQGESRPRLLGSALTRYYQTEDIFNFLTSAFIREGAYAGKIAVARRTEGAYVLSIFDPLNPAAPEVSTTVNEAARLVWSMSVEDEGGLLFVGERVYGGAPSEELEHQGPLIVRLSADGEASTSELPQPIRGFVSTGWVRDGRLVFLSSDLERDVGFTFIVYSLPLSRLGNDQAKATEVFSRNASDGGPGPYEAFAFGRSLLAYIQNGELHTRTYDSIVDVKLETGVLGLYDAEPDSRWSWLR